MMTMVAAMVVCLGCLASAAAANPPTDPVEAVALESIATKLRITKWSFFNADPCSGEYGWNDSVAPSITCVCETSACYIKEINLYQLSLVGEIPPEFGNLTHVTSLSLQHNGLSGRIPEELGSLSNLIYLDLSFNNLTGEIPAALGNMSLLQSLKMSYNLLSGSIPIELGRMSSLQKIDLGINRLTGPVPSTLGNLTLLVLLAIGSNSFSGSLPQEIWLLTNLNKLYMDSSNISGEIPKEIGNLRNLELLWMFGNQFSGHIPNVFQNMSSLQDLSIGDISNAGSIPSIFNNLSTLAYLSLRNNGLSGRIPEDIGSLSNLFYLDLSFNNLTGEIPAALGNMPLLESLLLGNNNLRGNLPEELQAIEHLINLDVSYNQLSGPVPPWVNGSSLQANLLWNFFEQTDKSSRLEAAMFNCLDVKSPCDLTNAGKNVGFSINCGGPEVVVASSQTTFSDDSESVGDSRFFISDDGAWGVSNGGSHYDYDFTTKPETNSTIEMTHDEAIYQTARGSASSLRYYGLDMVNGAYSVELHFAEISITSDGWQSQGRRIFDVYIQESRVLEDFNIRAEANGSYKAVVKSFTAEVTKNVLEIHLFWSGKGTCCTPSKWTYGPLVSAIHVSADFDVSNQVASSSKHKEIVVVALILSGLFTAFLFSCILWRFQRKKLNRNTNAEIYFQNQEDLSTSIPPPDFSCIEGKLHIFGYHELKAATEDFNIRNQLGKGGFGVVFKGYLSDGTIIAVKQVTSETEKGNIEFMNEVATISSVQHRNLVKLLGCCIEGKERILVFEFLENNSLHQCLLEKCLFLDWPTRFNICVGIARGLTYLHEESRIRIVHRDIKASNILLDHNMNPKIADFGLAKLFQDDKTHISTCVAGTIGYLAPEYAFRGKLTEKADVYSFGILLLEIVSGRKNINANLPNEMQHLLEWTWQLYEEKQEVSLVDTSLDGQVPEKELLRVIHVALLCTQASAGMRPKMSEALAMLTGTLHIYLNIARPCFLSDLKHFPALREAATESVCSTNSPKPLTNNMAVLSSSYIEPR